MPKVFTGTLRPNEIFSAIYNMIISQDVAADNIKGTYSKLVEHFRVDGTLYGDTKLYYATDALESVNWLNDAEAKNLLEIHRPEPPKCQAITISNFRQIRVTVDEYLSKRAWSTEGAFSTFNGVIRGWVRDTKRVYDSRLVNVFIGTTHTEIGNQNIDVNITAAINGLTGEDKNRVRAQTIAQAIADLYDKLNDTTRDYNDYGFLRSYEDSDLICIMNTKWLNQILKIDLPTIFNQEGLKDKMGEYKLPARYFGEVITASTYASYKDAGTGSAGKPIDSNGKYAPGESHANGTLRTTVEMDCTVGGTTKHLFPGDELLTGAAVSSTAPNVYIEDGDIICKVIHTRSVPFMSAFEVGTSFYNPRSLTETQYLTWGYSDLDYLADKPFITLNAK